MDGFTYFSIISYPALEILRKHCYVTESLLQAERFLGSANYIKKYSIRNLMS